MREKGRRETWMYVGKISWLCLAHTPTREWAHSPDMCSDQESNKRPFALWDDRPSTNWATPVRADFSFYHSVANQFGNLVGRTFKTVPESDHVLSLPLLQYPGPSLDSCNSS